MAKVFRKLIKKIWMDKQRADDLGGVCADSFRNFQTDTNKLSVFLIDDNLPLERIAAAISAGRDNIQEVDYVVFDSSLLDRLSIGSEKTPGDTPDEAVNDAHMDLVGLTVDKVASLINTIVPEYPPKRINSKAIRAEIGVNLQCGNFDYQKLNPKIAQKFNE